MAMDAPSQVLALDPEESNDGTPACPGRSSGDVTHLEHTLEKGHYGIWVMCPRLTAAIGARWTDIVPISLDRLRLRGHRPWLRFAPHARSGKNCPEILHPLFTRKLNPRSSRDTRESPVQ